MGASLEGARRHEINVELSGRGYFQKTLLPFTKIAHFEGE